MYVGRSYKLIDFALWSRRSVIYMVVVSGLAVAAYRLPGIAGFSVPWSVVLVLGTTVSLVAGFKNSQVLTRSGEALQAFTQIIASSRMWSNFCRDFLDAPTARQLIYRHIAWMTALRFSLRRPMPWESMGKAANIEYMRRYRISEDKGSLAEELPPLVAEQADKVLKSPQPALALLEMQSVQVNALFKDAKLPPQIYVELTKLIRDFHDQQARCDRIKNNPYPRQYAIVSSMFVMIFCTLLPFGVVPVFAEMGKLGGALSARCWAGPTCLSTRSAKAAPTRSRAMPTTFQSRRSAATSRSNCARALARLTCRSPCCPSTISRPEVPDLARLRFRFDEDHQRFRHHAIMRHGVGGRLALH